MPASDLMPLWRQIGRESLWGRRGVVKAGTLWLPLAVILSIKPACSLQAAWVVCVQLFVASACRTLASILANDIADRADDRATGKERWILRFPPGAGVAAVAVLVGLGVLVLAAGRAAAGAQAAYGAAVALGLLYSIRPIRFKERGIVGPLAYGLQGALAYVVVPWAWLGSEARSLAILGSAVFLDKWVNLHFHQVVDYEADRARACRTYAVRVGLERARATLRWAAGLASVSMAGVLLLLMAELPLSGRLVAGVGVAFAAAAGVHAWVARRSPRASALVRELPAPYLGLTYALFRVLPPLAFARLALEEPAMWVVAGAAALSALVDSWHSVRYRYE